MTRSTAAATPTFLALSCVGFIASAPAVAHDAAATPPIAAKDGANNGANNGDDDQAGGRDDILVNGQRIQGKPQPKDVAPIVNTPRSIVTLPKDVIDQSGSASLADALRTVPGVTFGAAEGGNPVGDRPFIRGFDSQGSIFVDGVRDLSAQSREVFAIDSVQIVRGSDSTLGGRGSAGGTINIISKLPQLGNFASASASYGTDDYKRVTGDLNWKLADTVGFRVEGMWHDQDVAGRDAIWQRRWGVAPSLTIGLGTPTQLTASYYYMESHELPDSGIPYFYTIGNAPGTGIVYSEPLVGTGTTIGGATGTVDRSTFYGVKSRDFRDTKTHQATMRVEHDFGGVKLRNTTRYSFNQQDYIYTQPDDQQGNVYGTDTTAPIGDVPATAGGLVWRRANTRYGYVESLTNQTDLYGEFLTGGIKHNFAAGIELSWEKARRGTFVTPGYLNATGTEILSQGSTISPRCTPEAIARYYCTSLFDPNANDPWVNYATDSSTVTAAIGKTQPIEETQNDARTQLAYAFDSITLLPSLILNLGARFDRFKSVLTPGQALAATQTVKLERTDELFNWQAGLVFKPTRDTSLYASYATAATPPNALLGEGQEGNALPTTGTAANLALLDSLKVEKTKSYEVGAKGSLFDEKLALGVAAFQTDTDNARVTGPNNTVEFLGKRRIRGVELTANGVILPGWTVFGGYTHLDPKIVDGGFTTLTAAAITVGTTVVQAAKTVSVVSVNTGKQATQTARDSFTMWTNVEPVRGFQIGGGAFYTSRVFGGYSDNRTATQNAAGVVTVTPATKVLYRTIPDYWRFDARASYRFNPNVELAINVQNLTDKVYFNQAYTAHYASIAPGRSAFATLNVRY